MKALTGKRVRTAVQIFFFVLMGWLIVSGSLAEKGVQLPLGGTASIHALCPYGGVVTLYSLVDQGVLVKKAHPSSVVLAALAMFLAVLVGPAFCGWVCPFGTFQEWLAKLGRKLFGKRYNIFIPKSLDKVLRYLRYVFAVLVLVNTAMAMKLIFQEIDPYFALFQFWTGEVALAAWVILGAVVLLSLFVERPYCKYACPYGAVLGITNLFSVFRIRRNPATCTSCSVCSKKCPMNIDVMAKTTVRDHQCISCLKCTSGDSCPAKDTVVMAAGKRGA